MVIKKNNRVGVETGYENTGLTKTGFQFNDM